MTINYNPTVKFPKPKHSLLGTVAGGAAGLGMGMSLKWLTADDKKKTKFPDWWKTLVGYDKVQPPSAPAAVGTDALANAGAAPLDNATEDAQAVPSDTGTENGQTSSDAPRPDFSAINPVDTGDTYANAWDNDQSMNGSGAEVSGYDTSLDAPQGVDLSEATDALDEVSDTDWEAL